MIIINEMRFLSVTWIGLFIFWIKGGNGFTVDPGKTNWLHKPPYLTESSSDSKLTFTMWDPDGVLEDSVTERGINKNSIEDFFRDINSDSYLKMESTLNTVLFFVRHLGCVNTGEQITTPMDNLAECVTSLLNLTTIPAFVVFIKTEEFEAYEWFSKPLKSEAKFLPSREKGTYNDLYGEDLDLKSSITVTFEVVTDIVKDMYKPRMFQSSYSLFLPMGLILTSGFIIFGIWVFKMNVENPNDLDEEGSKMCDFCCYKNDQGKKKSGLVYVVLPSDNHSPFPQEPEKVHLGV